jgi:hypothetical protein
VLRIKIAGAYKLVRILDVKDGLLSKKTNAVIVRNDKIFVGTMV